MIDRQTQWDAPTWDVMAEDEDDMDLGTPTNDEIRVSLVSAVDGYFTVLFARLHSLAHMIRIIVFGPSVAFD